jgi:hypothetical protein
MSLSPFCIPLFVFLPAQRAYDPIELADTIHRLIHPITKPPAPPDKTVPANPSAPVPDKTDESKKGEKDIYLNLESEIQEI